MWEKCKENIGGSQADKELFFDKVIAANPCCFWLDGCAAPTVKDHMIKFKLKPEKLVLGIQITDRFLKMTEGHVGPKDHVGPKGWVRRLEKDKLKHFEELADESVALGLPAEIRHSVLPGPLDRGQLRLLGAGSAHPP